MKQIECDAKVENIEIVTDFINEILEENDCDIKAQTQIDIIIDEIFSNISFYAYPTDIVGKAIVSIDIIDDKAIITFTDKGIKFNPLENEDPDISLELNQREIGGLGVFMVKKMTDEVSYEYKDDSNNLRIVKTIK